MWRESSAIKYKLFYLLIHLEQSKWYKYARSVDIQNALQKDSHSFRITAELRSCVKVEVAVLGSPS